MIKAFCKSVLFLAAMVPFGAFGQQNGLDVALQKGNASDLGIYFSKNIELTIPGTEDSFSADQAVTILSDFFSKQGVKGYKKVHLSAPQEGRTNYTIGDLYTSQGTYRITIYFDTQQKITEIRIQK